MDRCRTLDLDLVEVMPSDSEELRDHLHSLLEKSRNLSAAVVKLDEETGQFNIQLKGTLSEHLESLEPWQKS